MTYYRIVHLKHIIIDQCYPNKFNLKNPKPQTQNTTKQVVKQFMKHDPVYVKKQNKTK